MAKYPEESCSRISRGEEWQNIQRRGVAEYLEGGGVAEYLEDRRCKISRGEV